MAWTYCSFKIVFWNWTNSRGVVDSSETFYNFGSMLLNSSPYQSGIDINFEAGLFRISEGQRLALEFKDLSDAMTVLIGGSNSYLISPPGSQSFPDPNQNLTFDLTLTANGDGTTSLPLRSIHINTTKIPWFPFLPHPPAVIGLPVGVAQLQAQQIQLR